MELSAIKHNFYKMTERHPTAKESRLYNDVWLTVYLHNGWMRIAYISVDRTAKRHKGLASDALNFLCTFCDMYGLEATLAVAAIGDKGMTTDQLMEWYKRHGFYGTAERMVRPSHVL